MKIPRFQSWPSSRLERQRTFNTGQRLPFPPLGSFLASVSIQLSAEPMPTERFPMGSIPPSLNVSHIRPSSQTSNVVLGVGFCSAFNLVGICRGPVFKAAAMTLPQTGFPFVNIWRRRREMWPD